MGIRAIGPGLALVLVSALPGAGQDALSVDGRQIMVTSDADGMALLTVNGATLLQDGVIYLDPGSSTVEGVTVVTGVAGPGGNACNPAPFVLALPEGGAPELWGPIDSCAYFQPQVEAGRLVFAADPLPGAAGETWVWTRDGGFVPGPAVGFVATSGWEALDSLSGAHPVDALALVPVLDTLQAGLGADFPVYARLIGGIGAGNLTDEGYLGSACDKPTCETDWAMLYLHRETQGVFAMWQVYGDTAPRVWPADRALWPPEALALLEWETAE
jgi:hypothetical protein